MRQQGVDSTPTIREPVSWRTCTTSLWERHHWAPIYMDLILGKQYILTLKTRYLQITGISNPFMLMISLNCLLFSISSIFFEDYYFDNNCPSQSWHNLDSSNGHEHGSYGYHYHVTVDLSRKPVFPYIAGPKYAGCQYTSSYCCNTAIKAFGWFARANFHAAKAKGPTVPQVCEASLYPPANSTKS